MFKQFSIEAGMASMQGVAVVDNPIVNRNLTPSRQTVLKAMAEQVKPLYYRHQNRNQCFSPILE